VLRQCRAQARPRTRRRLSQAGAAAVLTVAWMGASLATTPAAQAAAPTINCDTAAQPSASWTTCKTLVGTAKCVWNNKDGTYTMAMGYTNPSTSNLFASIPPATGAGAYNALTATSGFAGNPAHPATFVPGTYTTAFTVTWTPTSSTDAVSWQLMGTTRTWNRTMTACPTKPVPVIGGAGGLGLGLLGLAALAAFTNNWRGWIRAALRRLPVIGRPALVSA
jgi:hypothetical protein